MPKMPRSTIPFSFQCPNSRILLATPSNSSADLVLQRMAASGLVKVGEMARLNAFTRRPESIPEDVLPFSVFNEEIEDLRRVIRHRVIVTTCASAGNFYKLRTKRGHFSHCFIDEAGHATEPEALLPLGLVCKEKAQIVLAGDPKQLGPVLQSRYAKLYGLEESFLERLSRRQLYRRDEDVFRSHGGYDPLLVTRLVRNYRSHSSIIEIPSKLFYFSDLIPKAPKKITRRFLGLDFLPNKETPLIFHGVQGSNDKDEDSPSWFNAVEAFEAVRYAQKLIYDYNVKPEDVGIVTPYRKQVQKIRELARTFRLDVSRLSVGSVEEFQGQERGVIIISTVRSSRQEDFQRSVTSDAIHGLGFVQSDKRMNVALTRAQSLLIVIGDPHLLVADPAWKTFLEFAIESGCYIGCDLPLYLN